MGTAPNCGGINQPPCKPTSADETYTGEQMDAYGWACYRKGLRDGDSGKVRQYQKEQGKP
jgi:hypothetical protein